MHQNKTSRYFKYAIGEIILVVIGILIALQINNWNENKKSKKLALDYIRDISQDLVNDTILFNTALHRANRTIAKSESILQIRQANSIARDSLSLILGVFHSMRIYQINNATYSKLLNTGFLDSRAYSGLFANINSYYTKEYNTYSEFLDWDEEQDMDVFRDDFLGDFKDRVDLSAILSMYTSNSIKEELEASVSAFRKFIVTTPFRNKVLSNYYRKKRIVERLQIQKQLATELLLEINKELSVHD